MPNINCAAEHENAFEVNMETLFDIFDMLTYVIPPYSVLFIFNYGVNLLNSLLGMTLGIQQLNDAQHAKRHKTRKSLSALSEIAMASSVLSTQLLSIFALAGVIAAASVVYATMWMAWLVWMWGSVLKATYDLGLAVFNKQDDESLVYDRLLKHFLLGLKMEKLKEKPEWKNNKKIAAEIQYYENIQQRLLAQAIAVTKVAYSEDKKFTNNKYKIGGQSIIKYLESKSDFRAKNKEKPSVQDSALVNFLREKQKAKIPDRAKTVGVYTVAAIGLTAIAASFFWTPLLIPGLVLTAAVGLYSGYHLVNNMIVAPTKLYLDNKQQKEKTKAEAQSKIIKEQLGDVPLQYVSEKDHIQALKDHANKNISLPKHILGFFKEPSYANLNAGISTPGLPYLAS